MKGVEAAKLINRQDFFVDDKLGENRFRSWLLGSGDGEEVDWAGEWVCDRLLHHRDNPEVSILGMVKWGIS